MASTFTCPTCGAPLHAIGTEANINCEYCGASVIVPAELRSAPAAQPAQAAPYTAGDAVRTDTLRPDALSMDDPAQRRLVLRQGMQMIREGRMDDAAALLSQVTNEPLSTTRPVVDRIASALGNSGRINPLELMAILSQFSPGEDFWGPTQGMQNPPVQQVVRPTPRRRSGGAGCLIFILAIVVLYFISSSPAQIISQAASIFNQILRLLH